MSLHQLARHMASQGRDGDTTLVHMTPNEVAQMQQLAQQRGGSLTTNPHTGLPEANFLDDIGLGSLNKVAAPLIGAGAAYFGMDPVTAGMLAGGASAIGTGDLSKGLQEWDEWLRSLSKAPQVAF